MKLVMRMSNLIYLTKWSAETPISKWTSKRAHATSSFWCRMPKTGKLTTCSTGGPVLKTTSLRLRIKITRWKRTLVRCLITFYYRANRTNRPKRVKISLLSTARTRVIRFTLMTTIATFQRPVRQPSVQSSIRRIRSIERVKAWSRHRVRSGWFPSISDTVGKAIARKTKYQSKSLSHRPKATALWPSSRSTDYPGLSKESNSRSKNC